ncbi:hypothetical protein ACFW1P_02410 [Paenibacillus sp. NPDC058910]|uniref:hypothetical protein n=1 Tax=unclassified Paenibacillus TaxID=185978 RepID=UPI0036BE728F
MKAVPKVNTDGFYIEDTLVDDAFSGVVPFYAEIEPQLIDPDKAEQEAEEQPEEEAEPEIAGYTVGVPVTPGLFRPRFDLDGWQAYRDAVDTALTEFQQTYDEWAALPEDGRGDMPHAESPPMPDLWVEGLTPEEIEEITRPQPQVPSELERLQAENVELKLALTELAEAQEADKTEMQLALAELAEIYAGSGGEDIG